MDLTLFLPLFEILGTVAFAVSGAFVAIGKKMDIFGVAVLGLTTALGGGVIRDLILGVTPPVMFRTPSYAFLAVVTAVIVFIPAVRRFLTARQALYDRVLLLFDSVGLGVFTVVGVQAAHGAGFAGNLFLQIFVGTLTGVGGGILRDVMAQHTPYVFSKHVYASASLAGALLCAILWRFIGGAPALIAGAALTFLLRLCAAHFRWSLPRA